MVTIDIIGGGVAGLALAAGLDPHRFEVRVHERAPERHELGTVYGLWPHVLRSLHDLGLADPVRECARPATGVRVSTSTGRRLGGGTAPADSWLIQRPDLLAVLGRAKPDAVQRFDGAVEDPTTLTGDLVVGADGVHSVTRAAAWGSPGRRTGAMALRGVVDGDIDEFAPGDPWLQEFWGRGSLFGISPNTRGVTNWFASMREFRATKSEVLAWAQHHFAQFPAPVQAVLERVDPERVLLNSIMEAPMLTRYVRGRFVLVGDAAHAMSPNMGRGACEALVDGAILARCLSDFPLDRALREYQRRRWVRSQAVRAASGVVRRIALNWP